MNVWYQVFNHAQKEADFSVRGKVHEKALSATKSEQSKAYQELCSQDSDASDDVDERIFQKLRKKALSHFRASPAYEATFGSSVNYTFEYTLMSAMETTQSKIFNLLFHEELRKALESTKSMT